MQSTLKSLIPRLAGRRIAVVGDVILDEYLTGKATRMSREAPVPVLEFESRRLIPGGAANPSANITALGGVVQQIGVVGLDDAADQLRRVLRDAGIDIGGLVTDPTRPTTVKTRIMAQMGLRFPQQVARMDRLSREPVSPELERRICDYLQVVEADALLCSDYHGGLLTPGLIACIRARGGLLTADAQGDLEKYRGFTVVKCNAHEAAAYLNRVLRTDDDFGEAAVQLCARFELAGGMVITRGADGATLATPDAAVHHCPAPTVTDVYDTVGAGDTAIAVMTLAITAGATFVEAVTLANYASGLVVRRVGNYAPSSQELMTALS